MRKEYRIRYIWDSKSRKPMTHEEDELQMACVRWFDAQYAYLSKLLFHPKNGGKSCIVEGARFKKMGVRAGVPDLILLVSNGIYTALCIELKALKGRQSESQKAWQKVAEETNLKYVICRSLEDFMQIITNYLK